MDAISPICESARSGKNLWQSYRVYPDRVELSCWALFTTFVIPADQIREVEVLPPTLRAPLRQALRASLKLDLTDFFTHVMLLRSSGLFKTLAFTPDDPEAFAAAIAKIKRAPDRGPAPISPG